jgi:DNA uptake protein ComE-like DNA-binding protein
MVLFCACLAVSVQAQSQAQSDAQAHAGAKPAASQEVRVDLNHASVDDLLKLPGMTRTWAGRIVRFRPYRAKNELLDRGVLPSEVYARIKDSIVAHHDKP